MRRTAGILMLLAAAACEQPSKHVYSSPPPTPKPPPGTAPATSQVPEIPFGTLAAGARLVSITHAATGAPVALGSITDSVDVLTLVAFGPGEWAARQGGRVELAVRGQSFDTTLVRHLGAPAPSIAAQTFRLGGLMVGRYSSVARLRATGGNLLAESIPLLFEVVAR